MVSSGCKQLNSGLDVTTSMEECSHRVFMRETHPNQLLNLGVKTTVHVDHRELTPVLYTLAMSVMEMEWCYNNLCSNLFVGRLCRLNRYWITYQMMHSL